MDKVITNKNEKFVATIEKELNELLKSEGLTPNDKEVIQERIDRARYLNRDTETRSRINATRYFYEEDEDFGRSSEGNIDKNLPSIFDSKVTPEMIEIMKKSGQYKQLQEIYTDDQILEMFNTISDSKTPERSFNVLNARYGKELPTAQKGKSIITALLKKAKEWAPSVFGKIDNVAKNSDNVVKAVSNTSKKGLYEMLPIRQLESPTNYGSLKIDDGTVQNALDMLKAGAKGYVLKNVGTRDLLSAISQIMEGKVFYSNEIANKLINHKLKELLLAEDGGNTRMIEGMDENTPLSNRELQIIRLIAGEHTNEEIANKYLIGERDQHE